MSIQGVSALGTEMLALAGAVFQGPRFVVGLSWDCFTKRTLTVSEMLNCDLSAHLEVPAGERSCFIYPSLKNGSLSRKVIIFN